MRHIAPVREHTLVALGDSITRGYPLLSWQSYPSLVQTMLRNIGPDWQVINAGVLGDTAIMGCDRYARDVSPHRPSVVLISFGLNDGALSRTQFDERREFLWRAQHETRAKIELYRQKVQQCLFRKPVWKSGPETIREGLTRVSETAFVGALLDLIHSARQDDARPVLLSMTPVAGEIVSIEQHRTYAAYDRHIRETARATSVPLIDCGQKRNSRFDALTMLLDDGLHLAAQGQAWLAQRVFAQLMPILSG